MKDATPSKPVIPGFGLIDLGILLFYMVLGSLVAIGLVNPPLRPPMVMGSAALIVVGGGAWLLRNAAMANRRQVLERCPACGEHASQRVSLPILGYQHHLCLVCRAIYRQPTRLVETAASWEPDPPLADPWIDLPNEGDEPFGPLLRVKRRLRAAWRRPWARAAVEGRFRPMEDVRRRAPESNDRPPIGKHAGLTLDRLLRVKHRLDGEAVPTAPAGPIWDPWLDV
jgi:hypothetical protein